MKRGRSRNQRMAAALPQQIANTQIDTLCETQKDFSRQIEITGAPCRDASALRRMFSVCLSASLTPVGSATESAVAAASRAVPNAWNALLSDCQRTCVDSTSKLHTMHVCEG